MNNNININIPSVATLQNEQSRKEMTKMDLYNQVLVKCIEKIVYTNKNTDKSFIFFEVPKILIGQPFYDMKTCILFLINNLTRHNYIAEFIEPFYLYIDWGCGIKQNNREYTLNPNLDLNTQARERTRELMKKYPGAKIEYVVKK